MQATTSKQNESAEDNASAEMPWNIPKWKEIRSDLRPETNREAVSGTGPGPTEVFQSKSLVENGIGFVLGAGREGFLHVRFVGDDDEYAKMRFELDSLVQTYKSMLQNREAVVTERELAPEEDDPPLRERNMAKMFAVMLLDKKTRIAEKLYRVQIRSADPLTQKVKVYCVDEHFEHDVKASELIPLDNLDSDLACAAPLILKVHLHGIKLLRTKNKIVTDILTGEMLNMSVVHEWPGKAHPPEVSMDIFPSKLAEESLDQCYTFM